MGKKKSARTPRLTQGEQVRVKPGIVSPEFPDITCEGWTGTVSELIGSKSNQKYVIHWDQTTLDAMPDSYKDQCEEKQLLYEMGCFPATDLERLSESAT